MQLGHLRSWSSRVSSGTANQIEQMLHIFAVELKVTLSLNVSTRTPVVIYVKGPAI